MAADFVREPRTDGLYNYRFAADPRFPDRRRIFND